MSRKRSTGARPDYDVGYGKPPSHARFQPGRSGNPKGRPKKSHAQESALQRVLSQPIPIVTDGKRRTVPASEAVYHKLLQMALSDNTRAMSTLIKLIMAQEGSHQTTSEEDEKASPDDEAVIARYLQRQGGVGGILVGGSGGGDE